MSSYRLIDYQCFPNMANSVLRTYTDQGVQSHFTINSVNYDELYVDDEGYIHTASPDGALVSSEIIPNYKVKVFDETGTSELRSFNSLYW